MSHGRPHEEVQYESSPYAARIRAIEALLLEKGVLTEAEVQDRISYMEARSPANGARLVARAWVDSEFKARLLTDPKGATQELGIDASGPVEFVVVENTPRVHNLIVCTLCSCYPRHPGPSARLVQELRLSLQGRQGAAHCRARVRL